MKTLIGLVATDRRPVLFDGQDLAKLTLRRTDRHARRFGFVFQNAALFDSMTIVQNVAFPLRQHEHSSAEEIRRSGDAAAG